MAEKLFFSERLIDSWTDDEKVVFENDTLRISSGAGVKEYRLSPASRFIKVSDGGEDPHGVAGRVKTAEELAKLGADPYLGSCIIGETAYDVEPGYVAVRAEDETGIEQMLMEYLAKTLV